MKKVYIKFCDKDKIAMRSCWECNRAHEHLKKQGTTFWCFLCEKTFHNGKECELIVVSEKSENYRKAVEPIGFETSTFVLKPIKNKGIDR